MLYFSFAVNIVLLLLLAIFLIKNHTKSNSFQIEHRLKQLDAIEHEVKELNSIFTLPYIRGEAGETLLKELIDNYLPKGSYQLQYSFKNGARVDAIIKTGKYIVPIDSKFPMQSVEELLRSNKPSTAKVIKTFLKHGEDIAKKYIRPTEGTLNFAVMYIPSEKLYYKAFISEGGDLTDKMLKLGILPCSPSTLFSFIQTVVYGLKGFTFNQRQNELMENIETLKTHYNQLKRQFKLSNNHLKNLKQSLALCDKIIDETEELIPE